LRRPDVDRGEALADRGPDGALQGHAVLADRVEHPGRKRVALGALGLDSDHGLFERQGRPDGVEDRENGVRHFRPDAIAPNESDRSVCCRHRVSGFFSGGQDHLHPLDGRGRRLLDHEIGLAPLPPLALARDPAEAEHQVPRDRLGFVAGEAQAELLLDLVEPEAPLEEVLALSGGDEPGRLFFVELVLDRPEDLLDRVLDRDDARRPAELVDDDRDVGAPPAHLPEDVLGPLELGHEERLVDVLIEPEALLLLVGQREEVLDVEDPDDVVERPR
jgi:hypothetical protein